MFHCALIECTAGQGMLCVTFCIHCSLRYDPQTLQEWPTQNGILALVLAKSAEGGVA